MKTREIINFGMYDWLVLDRRDDCALIISDKIIANEPYHDQWTSTTWADCALRKYLNGSFLDGFSENDRARIITAANQTPDNPWYETTGGENTSDSVFLPCLDEIVKYFGDSGDFANRKGWYYDDMGDGAFGWVLQDGNGFLINDEYNENRIAYNGDGKADWWWLRSSGNMNNYASFVNYDGFIYVAGNRITHHKGGVRPALWLKLE